VEILSSVFLYVYYWERCQRIKKTLDKQSCGGESINTPMVEGFQLWICKGKSRCQKPSNARQIRVNMLLYDNLFCTVFTIQTNFTKMHTCFNKNADYSFLATVKFSNVWLPHLLSDFFFFYYHSYQIWCIIITYYSQKYCFAKTNTICSDSMLSAWIHKCTSAICLDMILHQSPPVACHLYNGS
jgi:hypothetical protein